MPQLKQDPVHHIICVIPPTVLFRLADARSIPFLRPPTSDGSEHMPPPPNVQEGMLTRVP